MKARGRLLGRRPASDLGMGGLEEAFARAETEHAAHVIAVLDDHQHPGPQQQAQTPSEVHGSRQPPAVGQSHVALDLGRPPVAKARDGPLERATGIGRVEHVSRCRMHVHFLRPKSMARSGLPGRPASSAPRFAGVVRSSPTQMPLITASSAAMKSLACCRRLPCTGPRSLTRKGAAKCGKATSAEPFQPMLGQRDLGMAVGMWLRNASGITKRVGSLSRMSLWMSTIHGIPPRCVLDGLAYTSN